LETIGIDKEREIENLMEVIRTLQEMKAWSRKMRGEGRTIGLVPTMGYLHEGHLELARESLGSCDCTVVSIFVNPVQFGPGEDLDTYPVDLEADQSRLQKLGVHAVFIPQKEEMYPQGFQTQVQVKGITRFLCGESRPALFQGVSTVVLKLFHIVQPHRAFFGEKDRQQLEVVRTMTRDLNLDIEITGVPIVREPDGLALSSRNSYLSPEERVSALSLSRSLEKAEQLIRDGESRPNVIRAEIQSIIENAPGTRIDYISISDPGQFSELDAIKGTVLVALAVHVGKARLIDNRLIEKKSCKK
jgi:pantoate--beta-alanine ligase